MTRKHPLVLRKESDCIIGICPHCNKRLSVECGCPRTIETEAWYAAHIAAEQLAHHGEVDVEAWDAQMTICNTDPEHVLNAAQEVDDWMQRDDAAATYGEAWLAEQDAMARDYEDWMQQTEDLRHGG